MSIMVHTTIEDKRMVYHDTRVAEIKDGNLILNSGGWMTQTTKKRMNQFCDMFGLPYHVYQEDFDWHIVKDYDWDNPIEFFDGISLPV